jgi:hypothetical protein
MQSNFEIPRKPERIQVLTEPFIAECTKRKYKSYLNLKLSNISLPDFAELRTNPQILNLNNRITFSFNPSPASAEKRTLRRKADHPFSEKE